MASMVIPEYDPYPSDIQQTVIQPLNDPSHMAEQNIEPIPAPVIIVPVIATPATITPVTSVTELVIPALPQQSSTTTSDTPVSADIMNLVNNAEGLSIETVAHEAHRIHKKLEQASDEVFVSLR